MLLHNLYQKRELENTLQPNATSCRGLSEDERDRASHLQVMGNVLLCELKYTASLTTHDGFGKSICEKETPF